MDLVSNLVLALNTGFEWMRFLGGFHLTHGISCIL